MRDLSASSKEETDVFLQTNAKLANTLRENATAEDITEFRKQAAIYVKFAGERVRQRESGGGGGSTPHVEGVTAVVSVLVPTTSMRAMCRSPPPSCLPMTAMCRSPPPSRLPMTANKRVRAAVLSTTAVMKKAVTTDKMVRVTAVVSVLVPTTSMRVKSGWYIE